MKKLKYLLTILFLLTTNLEAYYLDEIFEISGNARVTGLASNNNLLIEDQKQKKLILSMNNIYETLGLKNNSVNFIYPNFYQTWSLDINWTGIRIDNIPTTTGWDLTNQIFDENKIVYKEVSTNIFSVAAKKKVVRNVVGSIAFKYLQDKVIDWNNNIMAVDGGVVYSHSEEVFGGKIKTGAEMENVYSSVASWAEGYTDRLSMVTNIGLVYETKFDWAEKNSFLILTNYNNRYNKTNLGVGIEFNYSVLSLRSGYKQLGSNRPVTKIFLGTGIRFEQGWIIDYSYMLSSGIESLGGSHYVSVSVLFNKK